ncbi:DUF2188 domain-containing protein [Nodosilinea sp. LEGE 07298]|uniref:DUF2188 domain-containing protein n=1 Tax=Nodosilinea sp. LEGE 07298 TaxID=2777970 RepID=UPI0037C6FE83
MPDGTGWIATQSQKRIAQGQEKADVVHKAEEKAKAQKTELYVHNEQGDVAEEKDYS